MSERRDASAIAESREQNSIPRKRDLPEDLTFENLRREGIRFAQELSGKLWTDYNLHDPGVTILDHLCYAITDLVYRSEFDVADFLAGPDGNIDHLRQALHPPESIFPCRPTTITDYRTMLLDAIPEIDDVWLRAEPGGLYSVEVSLSRSAVDSGPERQQRVLDEVKRVYLSYRNLCEDIKGEVRAIRHVDCELHGEIDVTGARDPARVLAEIYFRCSRHVAAGIHFNSFEQVRQQDKTLEEIFSGPRVTHGVVDHGSLAKQADKIFIAELVALVNGVAGVDKARSLSLRNADGTSFFDAVDRRKSGATLRLRVPRSGGDVGKLALKEDGRLVGVAFQAMRPQYEKLTFAQQAARRTPQDVAELYSFPRGRSRNLGRYSSIQNQFPNVYGINAYSVPASAPAEVKARALQLKAYLLLFEQILATFAANLEGLRDLFSARDGDGRSYRFRLPGEETIPGISKIYAKSDVAEILDTVFGRYDRFIDRRGRLLDYLLALYGETLPAEFSSHLRYYCEPAELDRRILESKTRLLEAVVETGRDRAGAFDYGMPSWNCQSASPELAGDNVSGLERRVSLLLGFLFRHRRSLTMPVFKRGFRLVPHDQFRRLREGTQELRFIALDESFHSLTGAGEPPDVDAATRRREIERVAPLKGNLLSEALFRRGIDRRNYRLGRHTASTNHQLVIRPGEKDPWWYLGTYPDEKSGNEAAELLRRLLIEMNTECEGLHVVEHVLLRPEESPAAVDPRLAFRVTVIFPSWTARFHDRAFRHLAEDTVRGACPAHIHPEIHWLGFEAMCRFEEKLKNWLDLKCLGSVTAAQRDAAAISLQSFLEELLTGEPSEGDRAYG